MPEFFLFTAYALIFLFFVWKTKSFAAFGLIREFIGVFAVAKVLFAIIYYFWVVQMPTHYDTTIFLKEASVVYSSLEVSVWHYLELVFGRNDYIPEPEYLCPYIDQMGFWYDHGNYSMVRINALFKLFSYGYDSIHYLFFSILSFIGAYNLYRFFEKQTLLHEWIIALPLFYFPGTILWTSGGHKEAVVYLCIGVIFNLCADLVNKQGIRWLKWMGVIFFLLLLAHVRFYTAAIVAPAIFAYLLYYRFGRNAILGFLLTYGLLLAMVVFFDVTSEGFRFAGEINVRQVDFMQSNANTRFEIPEVGNSWTNIFKVLPYAIFNPIGRPFIWDCTHIACVFSAVESLIIVCLLVVLLIKLRWRNLFKNPEILLSVSVAAGILLLIGLIVNNSGAIVRYRSVAIPLLIVGLSISQSLFVERKKF